MGRNTERKKSLTFGTIVAICSLLAALIACAPVEKVSTDPAPKSNDTVITGDLNRFEATGVLEAETGPEIGFDEEAQLQQDKITGGASGTLTSKNIQPMEPGITGYSDEAPPGFVATTGEE
jgi:hypothetical protein